MKHFLPLVFAFVLVCSSLKAQDPMLYIYRPHWPLQSTGLHHSLAFSGEYTAGSDGLTNSFINGFYKGGFIDADKKAAQESKLHPSNRFGGYASYAMAYTWRMDPDSGNWEFTIAYRDRQSLYGKFSKDAFRMAFEGNRAFKGQTANLDDTKLTYLHWQQLQFEAKFYSPDKKSDATFGFSVLNGQQLQEINIRTGSVYTASDGSAVDVGANAAWFQSDTAHTKTGSKNGSGSCFNFRFNAYLGDSAARYKSQFSFMVQDIGFIRWNANSLVYAVDTNVHYTGVDASSVLINDGNFTGIPDSDSLIGEPSRGQIITFLPLGIRMRYTLISPASWWGGIDARAWSYGDAIPQITLFGGWHNKTLSFNVSGGAAWGGYSRFQFPVQIGWEVCKNFALIAGTTNIVGYIASKKSHGQGLYLNLSLAF
ncbi:MAG: DUF5723 family protein [Bacteroidia bacterium]